MTTTGHTGSAATVDLAPTFPVLDTVRAIGALAVLTTHTTFQSGTYLDHGVWGTFMARLDVGVAIFFVLSGFLLARPHFARASRGIAPPDLGRYALKRVLRIYPAYLVTVVLALTLVPRNAGTSIRDWIATLLLIDPYVRKQLPHGLTHMWSLSAEVAFYALLPLLMVGALGRHRTLRPARVTALLVAMVLIAISWHLWLAVEVDVRSLGAAGLWLPGYLTWFAVGIWLAMEHVRRQEGRSSAVGRMLASLGAMPGTCWVMVAGLLLIASTPLAGPVLFQAGTSAQGLSKNLLYTFVGALVVLTGVYADGKSGYSRAMSLRPLRHLGHISYGIFCLHLAIISLVFWATDLTLFGGQALQVWLLTVALSLVAAEVLYRLVELPAMGLARRRRPRQSTPQEDAATTATTTHS